MERLAERDLRGVLDGVYDLLAVDELDALPAAFLDVSQRLVGSDLASYNEVDLAHGTAFTLADPAEDLFAGADEVFAAHASGNPMVVFQARTGDGTARRISDFIGQRELHRRPIYSLLYGPLEVEYQAAVGLASGGEDVVGVTLNRSGRDFSGRDLAVLETLRPFFVRIRNRLRDRDRPAVERLRALGLTARQAEVVALVAAGRSNGEIAALLVLSEHTVAKHLENAYRTLGVANRAAAVGLLLA